MKIVKLSEILPITDVLEVSTDVGVTLSPLNLEQIISLFWQFQDQFIALYAEAQKAEPNYASLVVTAPVLVATAIAMSAGDTDAIESVRKFPATTQIVALAKVWKLSAPDPKKLSEALREITGQIKKAGEDIAASSLSKNTTPEIETSSSQT